MMPALTHFGSLSGLHRRFWGGSRTPTGRLMRTRPALGRRLRGGTVMFAVLALIAAVLAPTASAQSRTIGTVVLANGWSSADSAVASALAALESDSSSDAVVLYASRRALSQDVADFIEDHQPSEVILIGGTAALSSGVEADVIELVGSSAVRRVEGSDRFDTAAKAVPSTATTYIVANGHSPADTGVAAALAATRTDAAVLLATADSLTEPTERIIREQTPSAVEFVGGTAVLSASLIDRVLELIPALPRVPRHSGASRTDTAAAAAPNRSTTVVIANGWSPADMGVAAAYAAITSGAAVLYSQTSALTTPTESRIRALQPRAIVLVGGSAALDTSLHARLRTLASSATIQRISGSDRIDTALRAAERRLTDIATDPPAAPTSLTVASRNAGLSVSWTPPTTTSDTSSNDDPEVTGYAIQFRACTAADRTCTSSPTWGTWRSHSHTGIRTTTIISGLINGTTYQVQVRARNTAGLGAWSRTESGTPLAQTAKPSVPSGLTVEPADGLLEVSWAASIPPKDGTVNGYEVEYRECPTSSSCGSWTEHSHSGTDTTTTISRLSNGTKHEVRVQATSTKGVSGWSPAKSGTPARLPRFPGAPTLKAGDRKIEMEWNEPPYSGSDIRDYDVQYRACTGTDSDTSDLTCDPDDEAAWGNWRSRSHLGTAQVSTITGLINGTAYQVEVRASNSNGAGPWSDPGRSTPVAAPATPSRPTVDPGHMRLSVSWARPASNGATISGYDVQHCDTTATGGCSTESNWTPTAGTAVSGADSTTLDIEPLTNGTSYQVRVRVAYSIPPATTVEKGSWSSPATGRPAQLPDAPAAPILEFGDRKLGVSWDAPFDNGTTITGYVLAYRACTARDKTCPDGDDDPTPTWGRWTTRNLSETSSPTEITGLANGTAYQMQVRARISNGLGPWSSVSEKKVPRGLPARPTIRTVESRNSGLAVTWTRPSDNGSPITGYDVESCISSADCTVESNWSDGGFNDGAHTDDAAVTQITHLISGLANDTSYRVRVRAHTDAGSGQWSSPLASGTPAAAPDAPEVLTLTVGDRKLGVSWDAATDNGSAITGYVVAYRACTAADKTCPSGNNDPEPTWGNWGTRSVSASPLSTDVSGLTNGTAYQVRVQARNANGLGPWSESATKTPVAGPAKPTGLTLDVRHGGLDVSWATSSSADSDVTYEVEFQACISTPLTCVANATWGSWARSSDAPRDNTVTISRLTDGTKYQVRVRASRGTIKSDWSSVVSAIPAAVPDAPNLQSSQVTSQPRQINVAWTPPANDNGSAVRSYVVAYRACTAADKTCPSGNDDPEPTWGIWQERTLSGTQTTLGDLTNGTRYQVRVRARNDNGIGPWSAAQSATPVDAPAQPSTPRVISVDPSSAPADEHKGTVLRVDWIEPWDNGSPITGYELQYRACTATPTTCASNPTEDDWAPTWESETPSSTDRTSSITGLDNGTAYQVRLRAKNNALGTDSFSSWSSIVTAIPVGTPDAPETTTIDVASGNGQLIVSWGTPNSNGATVTGFKVWYCDTTATGGCSDAASSNWKSTNASASARSRSISGLTNARPYAVALSTTSKNHGESDRADAGTNNQPGGPDRPSNLRLTTAGSGQITATWSAPNQRHSPITYYTVDYRACAGTPITCAPSWTEFSNSVTGTTATITSLVNGTKYEVRVRAENGQGKGRWSQTASITPTG